MSACTLPLEGKHSLMFAHVLCRFGFYWTRKARRQAAPGLHPALVQQASTPASVKLRVLRRSAIIYSSCVASVALHSLAKLPYSFYHALPDTKLAHVACLPKPGRASGKSECQAACPLTWVPDKL